jgi:hypothetical protein
MRADYGHVHIRGRVSIMTQRMWRANTSSYKQFKNVLHQTSSARLRNADEPLTKMDLPTLLLQQIEFFWRPLFLLLTLTSKAHVAITH